MSRIGLAAATPGGACATTRSAIDRYDIDKMTAGRTFEEAASKLLSALYAL